jgi:TPR repeat protein
MTSHIGAIARRSCRILLPLNTSLFQIGKEKGLRTGIATFLAFWLVLTTRAAEEGDANAMYNLGLEYKDGKGVAQDYDKARQYFQKAADAGNPGALYNLGRLYLYVQGVAVDYNKARELFQKGADAGNDYAVNGLGVLYKSGQGVAQDYNKARELFERRSRPGTHWPWRTWG